jgi:hypothetical protein
MSFGSCVAELYNSQRPMGIHGGRTPEEVYGAIPKPQALPARRCDPPIAMCSVRRVHSGANHHLPLLDIRHVRHVKKTAWVCRSLRTLLCARGPAEMLQPSHVAVYLSRSALAAVQSTKKRQGRHTVSICLSGRDEFIIACPPPEPVRKRERSRPGTGRAAQPS